MIFKFGELFCGPGGLAWASKNASINFNNEQFSIQHAWATDYDRDTCDTYRANICPKMPETVICKDIRKLDYSKLEKISSVDAIAFGFPCNDFSVVGEQKGINGVYGPLYSYGVKAVSKFKPMWFLAENVGGLRNANDGSTFTKILQSLFDEGYSVYPHLYKFEKYGVPQARHRIIIVGIRKDLNVGFNIPSSNGYTVKSCREAIEDPPINKNVNNQEFTKHSKSVLERLKYIKPGENAFTADIPEHLQLNVKGAKISQIYKRLNPNKPAYTVTGSGGGGTHVYHWKENRALTNRERARLQTFPDNFTFCGSKESVRKQIGMAVPPQGVQVVFQAILKSFAGIKYDCEESNMTPFLQPEHLTIYNEAPFQKQLRLCETQQEFQVCAELPEHLILERKMEDIIKEAKSLFDSIICLRVEGVEFYSGTKTLDLIEKEAEKGFDLCKQFLQQSNEADRNRQCVCPGGIGVCGFGNSSTNICNHPRR